MEPEAQKGRIEEAVDLGLRLERGVLVLQLEQVPEVQAGASGCGGLLLFRTLQRWLLSQIFLCFRPLCRSLNEF